MSKSAAEVGGRQWRERRRGGSEQMALWEGRRGRRSRTKAAGEKLGYRGCRSVMECEKTRGVDVEG